MSDLDEHLDEHLEEPLNETPAEVTPDEVVVPQPAQSSQDVVPSANPTQPVTTSSKPVATPTKSVATPTKSVATPTKSVVTPTKPVVSTPSRSTPTKKTTPSRSPAKHLTADSILVTGREDKVHPHGPPVSKYTKEQIEERVRARNRAKAHNDAAAGLASGETVFDRIAVKDSPAKADAKKPSVATPSPQKGDYNILVTGRDDKIKLTAKSPSKYTKEQIEDKVRARNRAKAHNDAARGLASGETVFDRIAVKDSPTKKPDGPSTPIKKDHELIATSRDDKIKSSPAHNAADIEAKAKARAKARTAASTKGGAGPSGDILERMFQEGIQSKDGAASST